MHKDYNTENGKSQEKTSLKARLLFTIASEQENTPYNLHQQTDALHFYHIIRFREHPVLTASRLILH
ncbi:MAG: hypothetical protein COT45_04495 [bacterium (Candidatus Stahlbacteria) CG08_land_8_20_14_0_20_40_26]|nr:MAG: hypothetical protein COX49_10100 [bacterium (Candidatus Stahlbacteria) CG23_combo_of_CG06-09_8_20_14_all_40_9]PIS24333.1 MAG: hypothetical protein COT45_04495 [bacterium (Candidatus Stahlbacteria) CG08_land_8_20_14_0_20_40_26]